MEFKDKFLQLRKDHSLNQIELAEKLGVSKAVISYWETGRNEPTLQMIKLIAEYFHVTADYLVGLEDFDYSLIYEHNNTKLIHKEKNKK